MDGPGPLVYKYARGVRPVVEFEWDPGKAAGNLSKHGVRFAEAVTVFEDDAMMTMQYDDLEEERFVGIGMGAWKDSGGRLHGSER